MADQTNWETIAVQQAARLQQLEAAQDKAAVDSALMAAVGTHPIHDHARPQVVELLRGRVSLVDDGRGGKVALADGKPVDEYVRERVLSQEFAHFRRNDGGGSRTAASSASSASSVDLNTPPKTLNAALMQHFAHRKATEDQDPRTNLRLPMGVRPLPERR